MPPWSVGGFGGWEFFEVFWGFLGGVEDCFVWCLGFFEWCLGCFGWCLGAVWDWLSGLDCSFCK